MKNKGQTLLEITVALGAILITLAAIAVVVTASVNNSVFIKNQTQSGKYAQQGMEYVRYLRNNNPSTYLGLSGTYCFDDGNIFRSITNPTNPCDITKVNLAGAFIRTAVFDTGAECGSANRVTVNVSWSSGKCQGANRFCHKSSLVSCFSDQTNPVPAL